MLPAIHSLDAVFLCVLLRGPRHGFGIAARIGELNEDLQPGQGALYPALRRLETRKLVRSREVLPDAERGGRPRRVYELTATGRRAAEQLARVYRSIAEAP